MVERRKEKEEQLEIKKNWAVKYSICKWILFKLYEENNAFVEEINKFRLSLYLC